MTLKILDTLFSTLHKKKISYVLWKSSIALKKSLKGEGDLDIFVKDKKEFLTILKNLNFKKGDLPKERISPCSETYFGLDEKTGKIVHLDLYFKLVTGKDFLRDYTLPLEKTLLESSTIDPKTKIRIPSKEFELILFILRAYLKENFKGNKLSKDMQTKFNFLYKQSNLKKVEKLVDKISFIPKQETLHTITHIKKKTLTQEFISKTNKTFFKACKKFSRYNFLEKFFIFHKGRVLSLQNRVEKGYVNYGIKHTKGIFVFLGCPGSGKTSTTKALEEWLLESELKGKRFYLGLSEEPFWERSTLYLFIPYNFFYKQLNKVFNKETLIMKPFTYLYDILVSLRWYGASLAKKSLLKKAHKKASKGYIVIIDRFPHPTIWKHMQQPMEGPTIPFYITFKNSKFIKKLQSLERRAYLDVAKFKNMQLFALDVDDKEAMKRGRREIEVVIPNKAIRAIKDKKIIRISKNLNFEDRLTEIKKKIWSLI